MIDSKPSNREAEAARARNAWIQRGILGGVCVLVVGIYAYTARPGFVTSSSLSADRNYYNLLVQGFRVGQLNLKKAVPPGFASLADPYDPAAYSHYAVLDLSYYKGKFYLYYGVTPAVALFWPYVTLTGHYLPQSDAAVIFCLVGFLASVGLLYALWRRYFVELGIEVVAAAAVALGLAALAPFLLARCEVNEVAISCGYALLMLTLAAIWKALHEPDRRCWWLAAASLTYALAVGARPSLLFGAVILLVPVAAAWRERRKIRAPLLAATGPMALIGLMLMLYNALRFGSPFDFGWRYALPGTRLDTAQRFHLRYLWFNFRVYFLEPARWSSRFPFVRDIVLPPVPTGTTGVDKPFGVLSNIPLVWLALAVPLAWRGRRSEACQTLRGFATVVAMLFGISAVTLLFFFAAENRYEVDFLPALVLLAVIGASSLDRALARQLRHRMLRHAIRLGYCLLLVFSVAFNMLASVERRAESHYNLGKGLLGAGQVSDAIGQLAQAVRIDPELAEARYNLGVALEQTGRVQEGIGQYEQALQIEPDFAEAHFDLGLALMRQGRLRDAISHYEQAARIKPDYAEAHYNLGAALEQTGRIEEAIRHYQQALRLNPDYPEAHNNLGIALAGLGQLQEAIGHYQQALRIQPDYAPAQCNWANALMREGKVPEAIGHYQQAVRIRPGFAEAHFDLGLALEKLGRTQEAIQHYQQAVQLKPDFLPAQSALARARSAP
jgi:tetratricopeptide (TPR) repeat protein